jgi:hypothetical protein
MKRTGRIALMVLLWAVGISAVWTLAAPIAVLPCCDECAIWCPFCRLCPPG